jgi:hypothetical protein
MEALRVARDVDVGFFDASDLSPERDKAVEEPAGGEMSVRPRSYVVTSRLRGEHSHGEGAGEGR